MYHGKNRKRISCGHISNQVIPDSPEAERPGSEISPGVTEIRIPRQQPESVVEFEDGSLGGIRIVCCNPLSNFSKVGERLRVKSVPVHR